tara:strand:+ start:441 stop:740 length:300 start_codon:yes stop_codon:yes gene_type:complete
MKTLIILKKTIVLIFIFSFLNNCAQNAALLGPIYTFGSTGSALQTGLSYGSDKVITKITGKSAGENVIEILEPNTNDTALRKLLKARIIETRKKLNLTK